MDEKKQDGILPEENFEPKPENIETLETLDSIVPEEKSENVETLETLDSIVSEPKPEIMETAAPVIPVFSPSQEETMEMSNSIEKTRNEAPATLNQNEVDQVLNQGGSIVPPVVEKKKKSKAPIIITIVLVLLIALVGLYLFFSNNPKTIFTKSVDTIFTTLEKNMKEPKYDITKGSTTIDIKSSSQDLAELNKIKFSLDYIVDNKSNIMNADLKTTYENNHLLNANIYMEDGKFYFNSADLLDKTIDLSSDETPLEVTNIADIKTITNSLNVAINKAIDGEKFTGNKIEIKVDGKATKTYRSSLTIDKNNAKTILTSIGDTLKKDTKFIKAYSKMNNITTDEAKELITDMIDSNKLSAEKMEAVTINIYTTGIKQNFVKAEITSDQEVTSITKISEEKYAYDIKSEDTKITGTITAKTEKNDSTVVIDAKASIPGEDDVTLKVNVKTTEEKGTSVQKPDLTNAVKAANLTDADMTNMYLKLLSNSSIVKLLSALS